MRCEGTPDCYIQIQDVSVVSALRARPRRKLSRLMGASFVSQAFSNTIFISWQDCLYQVVEAARAPVTPRRESSRQVHDDHQAARAWGAAGPRPKANLPLAACISLLPSPPRALQRGAVRP